jgi:hypothetical protein
MTIDELRALHNKEGKTKPRHEESKLQIACVEWFNLQFPKLVLFAIPNGGRRDAREAKIMKAEGVRAGVADLFLMFRAGGYAGLFIEMKYGDGRQSENQKWFEWAATNAGYKYVVCRSLEGFIRIIKDYLK